MLRKLFLVSGLLAVLFLTGCRRESAPIAALSPTPAPTVPAATPTLSPVPAPTRTPIPTFTVIPTNTPRPPEDDPTPTTEAATEATAAATEEAPTPEPSPDATVAIAAAPSVAAAPPAVAAATTAPPPAVPPTAAPTTVAPATAASAAAPPPSATPVRPTAAPPTAVPPTATPRPTQPPPGLGSLAGMADGTETTVSGQVVATASFSRGYKFTLADSTGRAVVLLWDNVYDDCWACPQLNIGAEVSVTGKIGRFDQELQIVPAFGSQVRVTKGSGPWATLRTAGELPGLVGQRVMVEGSVVRVSVRDPGTDIFLNDGTGEVQLFVWANTWGRVANQGAVSTPGTALRVVGWVQEFRGTYQVVPTLPVDVVIR